MPLGLDAGRPLWASGRQDIQAPHADSRRNSWAAGASLLRIETVSHFQPEQDAAGNRGMSSLGAAPHPPPPSPALLSPGTGLNPPGSLPRG